MGGDNPSLGTAYWSYWNDIFSSSGGYRSSASWERRTEFDVVTMGNKIWLMGGALAGNRYGEYANDVFFSNNGLDWSPFDNIPSSSALDNAPWAARDGHRLVKIPGCLQDNW